MDPEDLRLIFKIIVADLDGRGCDSLHLHRSLGHKVTWRYDRLGLFGNLLAFLDLQGSLDLPFPQFERVGIAFCLLLLQSFNKHCFYFWLPFVRVFLAFVCDQRFISIFDHVLSPSIREFLYNKRPLPTCLLDGSQENEVFGWSPLSADLGWVKMVHPLFSALLGAPKVFAIRSEIKLTGYGVPVVLGVLLPVWNETYMMTSSKIRYSSSVHCGGLPSILRMDFIWN